MCHFLLVLGVQTQPKIKPPNIKSTKERLRLFKSILLISINFCTTWKLTYPLSKLLIHVISHYRRHFFIHTKDNSVHDAENGTQSDSFLIANNLEIVELLVNMLLVKSQRSWSVFVNREEDDMVIRGGCSTNIGFPKTMRQLGNSKLSKQTPHFLNFSLSSSEI